MKPVENSGSSRRVFGHDPRRELLFDLADDADDARGMAAWEESWALTRTVMKIRREPNNEDTHFLLHPRLEGSISGFSWRDRSGRLGGVWGPWRGAFRMGCCVAEDDEVGELENPEHHLCGSLEECF